MVYRRSELLLVVSIMKLQALPRLLFPEFVVSVIVVAVLLARVMFVVRAELQCRVVVLSLFHVE